MIAATAIQKSNRVTRWRRRNSAMSIIPKTTASMITAPSTAFGRSENSGASTSSVASTSAPVISEATGVRAPGRLVQRARRQARRHRHPLEEPGADVRHALRDRLLVHVDAVVVARGERPRVAGGLGEADQEQRGRRDHDRRVVVLDDRASGSSGAGSPRGTSPTSATPCAPRSNSHDASRPADDEHERAGNRGAANRSPRITASATTADEQRRPVDVAERPEPCPELAPRVVALRRRPGQLRQLADHHVDGGTGEEAR